MAKDVLITPLDGIIQFSSSAGTGTGQVKVDGDDLVISNLVGDVLLGDGASDVFIGNGTDSVDIVFEQNGEIRDDGSGKNITLGSKTTNVFITSSTVVMQKDSGNVGIGTTNPTTTLQVEGDISGSGNLKVDQILFNGPRANESNNIKFEGLTQLSSSKVAGLQWDFPSDDAFIYAHQSSSDVTNFVFEQRDNTTSDNFTFWFNDYRGSGSDSFPLHMEGDRFVVNHIYERAITYHKDSHNQINMKSNNVDFYLLKSGSSSVSAANSLIFGDVSDSQVRINGDITASGNISASVTSTGSFGHITTAGRVDIGDRLYVSNNTSNFRNINVGSGYGATGVTISTAGALQMNGKLTVDGDISGSVPSTGSFGHGFFDGKVGIGTSSPIAPLHIATTNTDTDNNLGDLTNPRAGILINNLSTDANTYAAIDFRAGTHDARIAVTNEGTNVGNMNFIVDNGNSPIVGMALSSLGNASFAGHITASGNISSSGKVITTEVESHTDFTLDVAGDITLDAAGDQINFKDNGSSRFTFNLDSTPEIDVTGNFKLDSTGTIELESIGNTTIDASGDIILSADGDQISMDDGAATQFTFNLSATPELDVNGDFTIDGTGDIKLDSATKVIDLVGNVTASSGQFKVIHPDAGGGVGTIIKTSGNAASNNAKLEFGDVNSVGQLTKLTLDDGAETITINAAQGLDTPVGQFQFSKTSNTDANHQGDVVFFGGTTSMTAGRIYHYKSDGTWEPADPNAASTCDGLLAVALGAASDTNGMLLRGTVTLDHDPGAVGDVLYLNEAAAPSGPSFGRATDGAPAGNGDIVRVIGYCLDASNGQIWFNPDNTFVEVSA